MKQMFFMVQGAMLLALVTLISGCGTTTSGFTSRFHDAASADVVLQFSRWDHIAVVQPELREGGFVRHFKREELRPEFDKLQLRRGTAVVVVGWTYRDEMLDIVLNDWKSVLAQCGFQRMVCLRAGNNGSQINGLQILDDSNLASKKQSARL